MSNYAHYAKGETSDPEFVLCLVNEQGQQRVFALKGVPLHLMYKGRMWHWFDTRDGMCWFQPCELVTLTEADIFSPPAYWKKSA